MNDKKLVILEKIDPKLSNIIKGYVKNFLKSNFWKVKNIMELDDAEQEAQVMLLFMEKRLLKSGKDSTIVTPQQYMATFKTCWGRHFDTLSNRDTSYKRVATESSLIDFESESDTSFSIEDLFTDDNMGFMECVLEEAPSEVKAVLNLLMNAPKEVLDAVAASLQKDVSSNTVLCRLLGYDSKEVNVVKLTKHYFSDL